MAASFCGTNTATVTTNTTATFSHTLSAGSNRVVVVFMKWVTAIDLNITGVTYGGVNMTLQGAQLESGASNGSRAAIYTLEEASLPSNGAQTVDPAWSGSSAATHIACYVWCLQDMPSPVFIASGTDGAGTGYYPTTATAVGVNANSVLLTGSVHNDVSTGALSCDVGTQDTELNTAGEIRCRTSYILDTGAAADESAVWSVASESANTKGASPILAIEYAQDVAATISAPLGGLTATMNATVEVPATVSAPLGGLTATMNAGVEVTATISAPLGGLTAAMTATPSDPTSDAEGWGVLV